MVYEARVRVYNYRTTALSGLKIVFHRHRHGSYQTCFFFARNSFYPLVLSPNKSTPHFFLIHIPMKPQLFSLSDYSRTIICDFFTYLIYDCRFVFRSLKSIIFSYLLFTSFIAGRDSIKKRLDESFQLDFSL